MEKNDPDSQDLIRLGLDEYNEKCRNYWCGSPQIWDTVLQSAGYKRVRISELSIGYKLLLTPIQRNSSPKNSDFLFAFMQTHMNCFPHGTQKEQHCLTLSLTFIRECIDKCFEVYHPHQGCIYLALTWSFRNHSDMLIWLEISYYHCRKRLWKLWLFFRFFNEYAD